MASELSHWFDGLLHRSVIRLTGASWSKIVVTQCRSWAAYPLVSDLGAVQISDAVSIDRNLLKSIDLMFRISKVSHLGRDLAAPTVVITNEWSEMPGSSTCVLVTSGFSGDVITRSSCPS